LTLPGWPLFDRPLRFVLIGDPHVGSHAGDLDRFAAIVTEVRESPADAILLLGDYMNMMVFGARRVPPDAIAKLFEPLTRHAPTFAALGNHDIEYGKAAVSDALRSVGIVVLDNSAARLGAAGRTVAIAGLADNSTDEPDLDRALADIGDDAPTILLAHDPAAFGDLPPGRWLMLSGHTHGGQVRLPWVGPVVNASAAPLKWTHGHIIEGDRELIVSAGLGTSGLPIRWRCPPELVELQVNGPDKTSVD
jgi:predicted MPP superfamily phosphohydrolase